MTDDADSLHSKLASPTLRQMPYSQQRESDNESAPLTPAKARNR